MIVLGERIRELRQKNGRTQEALAGAVGVTAQAVSRWEKGVCCPDVELIPSIANYFGVSIDELFGYDNERSVKVGALNDRIMGMIRDNNGVDVNIDECIALAREALIEFPGNEKLRFALASALFNAGYVKRGEFHTEDAEGFGVYDVERHRTYPEWQEAVKIYEKLLPELEDGELRIKAVKELSQLYKNMGEHEKALALSETAPGIEGSKPFLHINAFDGREAVAASGEALIETLRVSADRMVSIVLSDRGIKPKTAAELLLNAEKLFGLVFTEGDLGRLNGFVSCISMLRSYYLWLAKDEDAAFDALYSALAHAKALDGLYLTEEEYHSSPLLKHVKLDKGERTELSRELPELWPWWDVPERDRVKEELQADARWAEWARGSANA